MHISRLFVAYISNPAKNKRKANPTRSLSDHMVEQKARIHNFIEAKQGKLVKIFLELGDNKSHRHPLPELEAAVSFAIAHQANLVINDMHALTTSQSFSRIMSGFIHSKHAASTNLYCCEQPEINKQNLMPVLAHTQQQSKFHGQLIKKGLLRSKARSGNPNASNVIHMVNKPKIDNAILFSLTLTPVIHALQMQGLSQRKMVARLNEEGFLAPEGGTWVLSQLQKVISRIKLNESALRLKSELSDFMKQGLDAEAISKTLNQLQIPAPEGISWNKDLVDKTKERLDTINQILALNNLILLVSPLLEKYSVDVLSEDVLADELQQAGVKFPNTFYHTITEHGR